MVRRRRIDCIYCTRELLYSIVSRLPRLLMILINIHRLGTTQIYKMSCLSLHSVLQLSWSHPLRLLVPSIRPLYKFRLCESQSYFTTKLIQVTPNNPYYYLTMFARISSLAVPFVLGFCALSVFSGMSTFPSPKSKTPESLILIWLTYFSSSSFFLYFHSSTCQRWAFSSSNR